MITRDEFCLIFRYQHLSTSSVGNELGQQMMRIQFLILGFKGLNRNTEHFAPRRELNYCQQQQQRLNFCLSKLKFYE